MTGTDPAHASTLEQQVAAVLDGRGSIDASPGGGGRSWSKAEVTFAVVGPFGVEIRLDPAVASAAIRTPDTAPSPRGPEWVRYNPRVLDAHALDRLQAWLDLAERRAGSSPTP